MNKSDEFIHSIIMMPLRERDAYTIIKVCKEAGLKFVDFPRDPEGCSICKVEEIDV